MGTLQPGNGSNGGSAEESGSNSVTAFGEQRVARLLPVFQHSAAYNYIPSNMETFNATGGTVGAADGEFVATTGTSIGGYGVIRSKRALKYKAGQGALARFTARFSEGVANSLQFAGFFTSIDALAFGYDGTSFGVLRQHHGALEVQELQITGAAGGSENATVTIDGIGYTVPLTSGTVQHNAFEIEQYLTANAAGWNFQQNDDKVIMIATSDGDKAGTFSFSSSTATASFTEIMAGALKTSEWFPMADWNGEDASILDPQKGNVYEVNFQYLGYGAITFSIENPATGKFIPVHTIRYANNNTRPSLSNPSMKVGIVAASLGSTTDLTVATGSLACFNEGESVLTNGKFAKDNSKSGISTTPTNILTIRNRLSFHGIANQGDLILRQLSSFTDSNKGASIDVYLNPTLGGETNYQYEDENNSIAEYDTSGTTITGGILIASTQAGDVIDLGDYAIVPGDIITIAGNVNSGAASEVTVSLNWREDV